MMVEGTTEMQEAVRNLESDLKQREALIIQSQQNMQQTTSHVEHLEIELKKTKEIQARATLDAETISRNLNTYSSQVENAFNSQMEQLRQLQQVQQLI
jgi:chromosome segregation ATPase